MQTCNGFFNVKWPRIFYSIKSNAVLSEGESCWLHAMHIVFISPLLLSVSTTSRNKNAAATSVLIYYNHTSTRFFVV